MQALIPYNSEQTVQYIEQVLEVQDAVESALVTLGDGNWRMGEGVRVAKVPKLGEGSEHIILEHFICECRARPLISAAAVP